MPSKIFKIWRASAVVGFMMALAAGCASFSNFSDTSLPENIHLRTAGKYQSERVGIFRFDSVIDAPRAGEMAADLLYKQLLKDRAFQVTLHGSFQEKARCRWRISVRVAEG